MYIKIQKTSIVYRFWKLTCFLSVAFLFGTAVAPRLPLLPPVAEALTPDFLFTGCGRFGGFPFTPNRAEPSPLRRNCFLLGACGSCVPVSPCCNCVNSNILNQAQVFFFPKYSYKAFLLYVTYHWFNLSFTLLYGSI